MGGSSKKGGGSPEVTDYFLAIHYGICMGPVDRLRRVFIGEKEAWSGTATLSAKLNIFNSTLFGGNEKEGGVGGVVDFTLGDQDEDRNPLLAEDIGVAESQVPAYRGLCTAYFRSKYPEAPSFYWGTNYPSIKDAWFDVTRYPKPIGSYPSELRAIGDDANPAAIILECLTSRDYGMWTPESACDVDSFISAGQTLADEEFGLSLLWTQQESIEDFIADIQAHINAMVFTSPSTGLLKIKLIRDDYDPEEVPVIDPSNCRLDSFKRRSWGETINEIIVKWKNPDSEKDETVTVQDLSNIAMQGSLVSSTNDFPGIRSRSLALRVAQRELSANSSPLASANVRLNRKLFGQIEPGQVMRLNWPRLNTDGLFMRVQNVNLGSLSDNMITVELIEDIYALPATAYSGDQGTQWVPTTANPEPALREAAFTLPYYFLVQSEGEDVAEDTEYPDVLSGVIATQDGPDTSSYDIIRERMNSLGEVIREKAGQSSYAGYTFIVEALSPEAESVINFQNTLFANRIMRGTFLWVGKDIGDENGELMFIRSFTEAGAVVSRGVLDTVPVNHAANTGAWVLDPAVVFVDGITTADGEDVSHWVLPKTSQGTLNISQADEIITEMNDRPYRPYRPGNVLIGGLPWPDEVDGPDIELSWATRDRELETTEVRRWSDGNVGTPAGVTYTLEIINADDDSPIALITGITDLSYTYSAVQEFNDTGTVSSNITVRLWAVDSEGFESWQKFEHTFVRPSSAWSVGWGSGWGADFGE